MTRRHFLELTGATTALAAVGFVPVACDEVGPSPPDIRPLLRLPRVFPADIGHELVARASTDLAPDGLGYGGAVPGPVLEARRGGEVHVVLRNELGEPTTLHSHGAVVPHEMDGHPLDEVAPGGSFVYRYPVRQRAGLLWVHPHPHGRVARQVYRGLAGFLVVRDAEEDALALPSGERELFLAVRDAAFEADGRLRYRDDRGGFWGNVPVVNGVAWPRHEVATAVYRLRLLNAANARVVRLALSSGAPLTVIGNDGGLLPAPASVPSVELGPAERLDVLLDLRDARPGDRVALRCEREGWDVLDFEVTERVEDRTVLPTALPAVGGLTHGGGVDRTFRFQGHLAINGDVYRMGEVRARVPFGRVERWALRAEGGGVHPVHVHGAHVQVVSRESVRDDARSRVFAHERGWKDTVLLLDNESAEVLVRFDGYRGRYLLHCHKLEHEDHGMMLDFLVE